MALSLTRRTVLGAAAASAALAAANAARAQLRIEIFGVGANQIPIALEMLNGSNRAQFDLMRVVAADL